MEPSPRSVPGADPRQTGLIDEIRSALERADLAALARAYADDAVMEVVSSLSSPAHPTVVRGREAILEHLRREILHDPVSGWSRHLQSTAVIDEIETTDAIAFTEVRTYVAGDKAIAQHLGHKQNGRIVRDRVVVAWDSD